MPYVRFPKENYLTRIAPIQTWWELLNVGSLGVFVIGFLGAIPFTYNWSWNPLLWRLFSPKAISIGPGNHHTLIIAGIGLAFLAAVWIGKLPPLLAAFGMYFMLEAHELEWYFTYYAAKIFYHGYFQWWWLQVTLLAIPIVVFYVLTFGVPWRFLAWMGTFYGLWFLIGFPITEDFPGFTTFYTSTAVNLNEFDSWLWALLGFFYFIFPRLKKVGDKINMKWWNPN